MNIKECAIICAKALDKRHGRDVDIIDVINTIIFLTDISDFNDFKKLITYSSFFLSFPLFNLIIFFHISSTTSMVMRAVIWSTTARRSCALVP